PRIGTGIRARGVQLNEPLTVTEVGPPLCRVNPPIVIIVARDGALAVAAPPRRSNVAGGAVHNFPFPVLQYREICPPIPVVVRRYRDVTALPPLLPGNGLPTEREAVIVIELRGNNRLGAVDNPQLAGRWPPDGNISQFVPVIVAGYRNIIRISPLLPEPTTTRVEPPIAGRWAP